MKGLKEKISALAMSDIVIILLTAWIICAVLCLPFGGEVFKVPTYADSVNIFAFVALFVVLCAVMLAVRLTLKNAVYVLFIVACYIYGTVCAFVLGSEYAAIAFSVALLPALIYVSGKYLPFPDGKASVRAERAAFVSVWAVAAAVFAALFVFMYFRYATYCAPCFDFGIFAQMFDNMSETLVPLTTCERGFELSHFAVHFSPVFYLLLPFYAVFPSPVTIIVAEAVISVAGVVPLMLICRKVGLSKFKSSVLCVLYLLFPALAGGSFYDFHENVFLVPFILFLMYFIEKEKYVPVYIFSLLVLSVKEDAAVYVAFVGIYLFLAKKKRLHGAAVFALSVAYFLTVCHFMMKYGQGVMLGSRYYNVIGYDGSFIDLIKTAIVSPALYIKECFSAEKLLFLLLVLLPVGALPLFCRRFGDLILLCPMIIMNLLTAYVYQYDIGFQYTFGTTAFLFYLAAINLSSLSFSPRAVSVILAYALGASLFIGASRIDSRCNYVIRYVDHKDDFKVIEEVLDGIDRNASVSSSTMFVAHMYDVDELYSLSDGKLTDYVIVDLRPYINNGKDEQLYVDSYLDRGYVTEIYEDGLICVLVRGT